MSGTVSKTYHASIDIGTRRLAIFIVLLDDLPDTIKAEKGKRKPKHRPRKWYKIPVASVFDVMGDGEMDGNDFTHEGCKKMYKVMNRFKKYLKKTVRIYIEQQIPHTFGFGRKGGKTAQNEAARRLQFCLASYLVSLEQKYKIKFDIRFVTPSTKFSGCPSEFRKGGGRKKKKKKETPIKNKKDIEEKEGKKSAPRLTKKGLPSKRKIADKIKKRDRGELQKQWVKDEAIRELRERNFSDLATELEEEKGFDVTDCIIQLLRAEEKIDREPDTFKW